MKIIAYLLQLHFSIFQLGKIQDIIDKLHKLHRTLLRTQDIFPLFLVQRRPQRKVQHTLDAMDRRTDFMTHIGQKHTFGPAGRLSSQLRLLQLCLPHLPLRNIYDRQYQTFFSFHPCLGNEDLHPKRLLRRCCTTAHAHSKMTGIIIIGQRPFQMVTDRTDTAFLPMPAAGFHTVGTLERITELHASRLIDPDCQDSAGRLIESLDGRLVVQQAKPYTGSRKDTPQRAALRLQLQFQPMQARNIPQNH